MVNSVRGPKQDPAVRNNDRVIVDDHRLAADLWLKLQENIPSFMHGQQALGLNERFRFYRYDQTQRFRGHVDAPYRRDNGEMSLLTFMIYLNANYAGGETTFPNVSVTPQLGAALIFRHEIFHEGKPVISGRKYV
ncbi:MAG: 2OG-Fe(II) oxygenase, partial [Micropepsaceae bacterium]